MVRLVLAVMATVLAVVLAISNSHHVELSLGIGKTVEIRLVFMLLTAFIIGMAVPVFYRLIRRLDRDKQMKRERELHEGKQRADWDLAA